MDKTQQPRFYSESDGDPPNVAFYVVDRYGDPLGEQRTTLCKTRREASLLAMKWCKDAPWTPWDLIQAERDGYYPNGYREVSP